MEFFTYRLPNGIRGIHRQVKSNVAHCALVINAGSRDEHPDQYGLAHLTEHAFFKGTQRRRAWQVNCRLENLGGELNAFTTKEDTTIHATTLRGDFPRAAELIADVAFRSTFPERELEREKEVIADEINTYKDSPADLIYDTFEDMLFAGSELGHNILGRKNALARYDGEAIRAFTGRTHTTDQMVFSSIGNFSAKTAEAVAARYFAGQAASARGFGTRIEIRSPDPACNPYLEMASCLAAGLDGIERDLPVPAPTDANVYDMTADERAAAGIHSLPKSLEEATKLFAASPFMREVLGDHVFNKYLEAKREEWRSYRARVSQWEIDRYLVKY